MSYLYEIMKIFRSNNLFQIISLICRFYMKLRFIKDAIIAEKSPTLLLPYLSKFIRDYSHRDDEMQKRFRANVLAWARKY